MAATLTERISTLKTLLAEIEYTLWNYAEVASSSSEIAAEGLAHAGTVEQLLTSRLSGVRRAHHELAGAAVSHA